MVPRLGCDWLNDFPSYNKVFFKIQVHSFLFSKIHSKQHPQRRHWGSEGNYFPVLGNLLKKKHLYNYGKCTRLSNLFFQSSRVHLRDLIFSHRLIWWLQEKSRTFLRLPKEEAINVNSWRCFLYHFFVCTFDSRRIISRSF